MGHWTQKPSSCVKQSFIEEELANETESGVLSFFIYHFSLLCWPYIRTTSIRSDFSDDSHTMLLGAPDARFGTFC